MVTLMFWCAALNSSTSFFMNGPSPPVKPFQYASATLGPSYVPVNSPPPPCWVPGGPELPPPQAAAKPAAPTAADRPRKFRREKPEVGVAVMNYSFVRRESGQGWSWPRNAEVVELGGRADAAVRDQPDARRRTGRQRPGAAPGPVHAVGAHCGSVCLLTGPGKHPVTQPQPSRVRGRRDEHRPVRRLPGVDLLLAELGRPGVPDGHVREAQEVVVAAV